jgi:putative redox protein
MIIATASPEPLSVRFTDGSHEAIADAAVGDGGGDAGFKPFALVEAALATCMTMSMRMLADRRGLSLPGLAMWVKMDVTRPDAPVLRYDVDFGGVSLSDDDRARLLRAVVACPVHKALQRPIRIEKCELIP